MTYIGCEVEIDADALGYAVRVQSDFHIPDFPESKDLAVEICSRALAVLALLRSHTAAHSKQHDDIPGD